MINCKICLTLVDLKTKEKHKESHKTIESVTRSEEAILDNSIADYRTHCLNNHYALLFGNPKTQQHPPYNTCSHCFTFKTIFLRKLRNGLITTKNGITIYKCIRYEYCNVACTSLEELIQHFIYSYTLIVRPPSKELKLRPDWLQVVNILLRHWRRQHHSIDSAPNCCICHTLMDKFPLLPNGHAICLFCWYFGSAKQVLAHILSYHKHAFPTVQPAGPEEEAILTVLGGKCLNNTPVGSEVTPELKDVAAIAFITRIRTIPKYFYQESSFRPEYQRFSEILGFDRLNGKCPLARCSYKYEQRNAGLHVDHNFFLKHMIQHSKEIYAVSMEEVREFVADYFVHLRRYHQSIGHKDIQFCFKECPYGRTFSNGPFKAILASVFSFAPGGGVLFRCIFQRKTDCVTAALIPNLLLVHAMSQHGKKLRDCLGERHFDELLMAKAFIKQARKSLVDGRALSTFHAYFGPQRGGKLCIFCLKSIKENILFHFLKKHSDLAEEPDTGEELVEVQRWNRFASLKAEDCTTVPSHEIIKLCQENSNVESMEFEVLE